MTLFRIWDWQSTADLKEFTSCSSCKWWFRNNTSGNSNTSTRHWSHMSLCRPNKDLSKQRKVQRRDRQNQGRTPPMSWTAWRGPMKTTTYLKYKVKDDSISTLPVKPAQSRYFESFWQRTKLPLNWMKPENSSLVRTKSTWEIIANRNGTGMAQNRDVTRLRHTAGIWFIDQVC